MNFTAPFGFLIVCVHYSAIPMLGNGRKLSRGTSLEEKLQALEVDVTPPPLSLATPPYLALGRQQQQDSGYLSHASNGLDGLTQVHQAARTNGGPPFGKAVAVAGPPGGLLLQTVEAQLKPHVPTRNLTTIFFLFCG